MADFVFVPHTADIAIRARGRDLPALLRAAALGVTAASLGRESLEPHRVPGISPRRVVSEGAPDEEGLLVTFLNELIYLAETHAEVYTDVEILSHSCDAGVEALAYPDPDLSAIHSVKAATYYDLKIERDGEDLTAIVVFDV